MISRATSGTGRRVFLAWRRSRLKAVWASTFSEAISIPLACSISTRESSATWSCLASRLLAWAATADPSRLATTPA
jgi:hypothetical protein